MTETKETMLAGGMVRLFMDGDRWCALYGKDLESGKAGFGATEMRAIKGLFVALGRENYNDTRWLMGRDPDIYLGGGVYMTLASAIVSMHCDERDVDIEALKGRVKTLADELDERETGDAWAELTAERDELKAKLAEAEERREKMARYARDIESRPWFQKAMVLEDALRSAVDVLDGNSACDEDIIDGYRSLLTSKSNARPEMEPRDWDMEPPKGMQHP